MDIAAISLPSAQTGALSRLNANFDTFLKLLTTQLRNQDPLDPLDTEKFTSQLVQFSQVEQSIETNTHLEALLALQAGGARDSAISLVGRTATFATDLAAHAGGGAAWTYELAAPAAETRLAIRDAAGRIVATLDGAREKGAHAVSWNGVRDDGTAAAPGVYRLVVEARDGAGAAAPVRIETTLRVDAASFADGRTLLETAAGKLPLDAIARVAADPR